MTLMVPRPPGFIETLSSVATTASAGTTVTGSATAHTKGAWATLVNDTGPRSLGIMVMIENTAAANANSTTLLDIGMAPTGSAVNSEIVVIPNLQAGFTLPAATSNAYQTYYFPLFIPAAYRVSARCQSVTVSKAVTARINLFQRPVGMGWIGRRVIAYGANTTTSRGVTVPTGSNAYGTATTIGTTTAPLKYMQIGFGSAGAATLVDARVQADVRVGATASIAGPLNGFTDTGTESVSFAQMNTQLQSHSFGLGIGADLRVASMWSSTALNLDYIIYGMD